MTILQMDNMKISYLMCGLFELSHRSSFMLFNSYLNFLVILAQFDYKYGDINLNDYI